MCGTTRLNPFLRLHVVSVVLNKYVTGETVCLRGGERGTCLGPSVLCPPSTCFARKLLIFMVKNVLSTHIISSEADQK